jgi:hypothetical protein
MELFKVIKCVRNGWTGEESKDVIMESDSEVLCYKQALTLQKLVYCDAGSPISVEYYVQ